MSSFNIIIKRLSEGADEITFAKMIKKATGVENINDLYNFVPVIFEISNATRDFMLRLPSLIPGSVVNQVHKEKEAEFMAVPQIGASGDAYDIWKNFINTAILTRYKLNNMFSGFNLDSLMPGIIKSNFILLTTISAVREFILKHEKKWNTKPDAYTTDWENLAFAKRLLDVMRENIPNTVNDIIFQLDPDISSDVLPSRNWIRISREANDNKISFTLHIFTTFAFHMLAEKPMFGGSGTLVARHTAEAGDIEISDNGGTMFLSLLSDSRMDIFSGNPNRHGLRIYGEWEFHSLQRAMKAYLKAPGITGTHNQRKYNTTMIFQNSNDLEEFCFIFANS